MTTSEQIHELATALSKAQGEIEGATRSTVNPFFRSKYADLASVREAIRAPFAAHGLSVVQFPTTEYVGEPAPYEWTAKQSGETRYGVRVVCIVSVVTRLLHASGQWMEDRVSTMLPTGDPQSVGSAISYLRRYALQSAAGVAPEDDDGEAAHGRSGNGRAGTTALASTPIVPFTPSGFDVWWTDMHAAADEGEGALRAAWERSLKEYRAYAMQTQHAEWEALKARARATNLAPEPMDVPL